LGLAALHDPRLLVLRQDSSCRPRRAGLQTLTPGVCTTSRLGCAEPHLVDLPTWLSFDPRLGSADPAEKNEKFEEKNKKYIITNNNYYYYCYYYR